MVTCFQEEVTMNVAVGTWSGLDLRRVCCQLWCVPLESTAMGIYRWQGSRAALADEDGLDAAVRYITGIARVHVALRNFRTAGGILRPNRTQRLQLSITGRATTLAIASLLRYSHTHVHSPGRPLMELPAYGPKQACLAVAQQMETKWYNCWTTCPMAV